MYCSFVRSSGRCFRLLVHSSQSFSAVINNHLQFTLTRTTWDLVCSGAIEGNPRKKKTVITFHIYLNPISIPKIGTCLQSRKAEKVCQKKTKISICYYKWSYLKSPSCNANEFKRVVLAKDLIITKNIHLRKNQTRLTKSLCDKRTVSF